MAISEFELITRYFSGIGPDLAAASSTIAMAGGDDCALLQIPPGQQLALSIDTLNAGVHFPEDASADDIARRSLAVAVSDLAAMGAKPLAFTLAISLPHIDEAWLQAFSYGLKHSAEFYGINLIGGDTTRGPLSIAVQVHGLVPSGQALRRNGARVGDRIFVTGTLGDAALALDVLQQRVDVAGANKAFLLSRFYQPQARLAVGQSLLALASAAIDISDGLLADLSHILKASGVAARIDSRQLPLSEVLQTTVNNNKALTHALTGGDDYELCFTVTPSQREQISQISQALSVPMTDIGCIVEGEGLFCTGANGEVMDFARLGYQHF